MPSEIPPSLRRSLLAPLEAGGRAAEVERRIEEAIELGVLGDGEQLPSETELAAELGVAPVTLREALVGLRRSGLVQTRRGRGGGTFVRGSEAAQHERLLARLEARSVDQLRDLCDEHVAIAATATALAAERALPADLGRLDAHVAALERAEDERAVRAADSRFHIELAVAARSLRLTKAQVRLQADVAGLTWTLLGAERAADAAREHREILAAVRDGDAIAAARAMRSHLARETAALARRRMTLYPHDDAGAPTARGRAPSRPRMAAALEPVEQAVEAVFAFLSAARDEVLRLGADGARWDATALGGVRGALLTELRRPDALVSGVGIAFGHEAALDGPRWTWWRAGDDAPLPLLVEHDPLHPDFYDYESAAWYGVPHATRERSITGPFIDFGAADDHIFTLAVPIPGRGREAACVGVVGADVRVARLERVVVPALLALGGEATLLNGHGVVIASSDGGRLPGQMWDRRRLGQLGGLSRRWVQVDGERLLRSDRLGWGLAAAAQR